MNSINKLIESTKPASNDEIAVAINEAVNTNNVSVGSRVAVVGDPTYPFDGIVGKVKSMDGGFSKVEFDGGIKVDLVTSLLVPV